METDAQPAADPPADRKTYNGIEHFPNIQMGLAHYRTLDPGIGRWLQVDPESEKFYGLTPYNSMGNNPVSMVDPDGDEPITAMLLGAAIGVISNGISNLSQGNNFFQGGLKAAAFGAIGGAFSYGIGQAASHITNGFTKAAFQTVAHGHTSGVMSGIQGGGYGSGFASGALSSSMSSGASELGLGNAGMIGVGGLSGGVGSHLAGGDFWTGVGQGVITSGLNHAAHSLIGNEYEEQSGTIKKTIKNYAGSGYGIESITTWLLKYNVFELQGDWVLEVSADVIARKNSGAPEVEAYLRGEISNELRVMRKLDSRYPIIKNVSSSSIHAGKASVGLPRTGKVSYSIFGSVKWGQGHMTVMSPVKIPLNYKPYFYPIIYSKNRRR